MSSMVADGIQFDSCVTDPPYHLTSITKRLGKPASAPIQHGTDGAYARATRGFMGKQWDGGDIAFTPEVWKLVFDLLKPGAHLLAFSGTRTYHRMAVAIEDAGFEIRDQIGWLYGSGFPKSHNVGKGILSAIEAQLRVQGVEGKITWK
jgi:site-specific DNA-methyltransferase (adenine-specific)